MEKSVHKSNTVIILTIIFMTILVASDIYLIIQIVAHTMPYILSSILVAIITATIIGTYIYMLQFPFH